MVVAGFHTKLAALVLTFNMAVACYGHLVLWGDSVAKVMIVVPAWPPVMPAGPFLAIFAILAVAGGGAFSVDRALKPKRGRKSNRD
jgi:uncharacterized membrane protein YphA (DoxX/SURF4 family)